MDELTLEGIGWTWSGPTRMVWDAETCTLDILVENAQVPAGQDDLREDLRITFDNVTYFKVIREPEWQLDQIEVDSIEEVDHLPSLGSLDDESVAPYILVRDPLIGEEPVGGAVVGKADNLHFFVLNSTKLVAEFTAQNYSISRLGKRNGAAQRDETGA